jgi:hypothetical protein
MGKWSLIIWTFSRNTGAELSAMSQISTQPPHPSAIEFPNLVAERTPSYAELSFAQYSTVTVVCVLPSKFVIFAVPIDTVSIISHSHNLFSVPLPPISYHL